ncbi:hypothetical protein [Mesorhizobium sp. 128a]
MPAVHLLPLLQEALNGLTFRGFSAIFQKFPEILVTPKNFVNVSPGRFDPRIAPEIESPPLSPHPFRSSRRGFEAVVSTTEALPIGDIEGCTTILAFTDVIGEQP